MPPLSLLRARTLSASVCLALLILFVFSGHCLAADPLPGESATVRDGATSITVSAGAKYLAPQRYKGSDIITNAAGTKLAVADISRPDAVFGPSVSIAAESEIGLEVPGLRQLRLVGEFSYSGGSARRSGVVDPGAGNFLILLSVDPSYNWIGGIDKTIDGGATSRVSISQDAFELRFGLEGKGDDWRPGSGAVTATPVFGAGLYASTQRYKVSTRYAAITASHSASMVETIRTTDIGPEVRAGMSFALPGGARVEALASAALLVGWADLEASQGLDTTIPLIAIKRSPTWSAKRSVNETLVSGLFGLTLRGDVPVAEKLSLGLEASGRLWTARPTIENPTSLYGTNNILTATNEGVRIGQDSASELGAALRLRYSF
ncbi:hypothetical protein SAMN04488503_2730 [Humidesulfovibrio mexicanus]|uniref:Porin n=1 Tax=Humidesulfovibrio mexicanus TaxID=147047 RepID=A0A239BRD6_9BACT|nr:hypothetical protein [Humidesulfovibrio mexicanus]SNS09981.1 hypothetical protein SAMN04488503_2730 [Humidesulfovibrio mexicanus]